MKFTIVVGDLADVPADGLCTSTNPRLSLAMGTGASIRQRGGIEILRACEAIIESEFQRSGKRVLPAGSAHATPPGSLPFKVIIHCVASDVSHRSSAAIVRACVKNALQQADAFDCRSLVLPVFATGHAHLAFSTAVAMMCEAIHESSTLVDHILIVVQDRSREEETRRAVLEHFPGAAIETVVSQDADPETASRWFNDEQ